MKLPVSPAPAHDLRSDIGDPRNEYQLLIGRIRWANSDKMKNLTVVECSNEICYSTIGIIENLLWASWAVFAGKAALGHVVPVRLHATGTLKTEARPTQGKGRGGGGSGSCIGRGRGGDNLARLYARHRSPVTDVVENDDTPLSLLFNGCLSVSL